MSTRSELKSLAAMAPLSDDDIDELADFLLSDATSDETMVLEILDGFLTAIAVGPVTIPPSQWLPRVWGPAEEHAPQFQTKEQAGRILELILRYMNGILGSLEHNPDEFEPMLDVMTYPDDPHEYLQGESWAFGFMEGLGLCRKEWEPLFADAAGREALRPIHLLGTDDPTPEEESLIGTPQQREDLSKMIPGAVAAIYRFWLPHRRAGHSGVRRSQPKVGRNEPCPCGSGRKFKQCCGASRSLQ